MCQYLGHWTYALVFSHSHTLPPLLLKHTFPLPGDSFITLSSSPLEPSSISVTCPTCISHFCLNPAITTIHLIVFFCVIHPSVSSCSLQLQGTVPLIWPSVHLIHLSWLQSEDQEDSHGSVQVTNSSLSLSFLSVSFPHFLPFLLLLWSWSLMHDIYPLSISVYGWATTTHGGCKWKYFRLMLSMNTGTWSQCVACSLTVASLTQSFFPLFIHIDLFYHFSSVCFISLSESSCLSLLVPPLASSLLIYSSLLLMLLYFLCPFIFPLSIWDAICSSISCWIKGLCEQTMAVFIYAWLLLPWYSSLWAVLMSLQNW